MRTFIVLLVAMVALNVSAVASAEEAAAAKPVDAKEQKKQTKKEIDKQKKQKKQEEKKRQQEEAKKKKELEKAKKKKEKELAKRKREVRKNSPRSTFGIKAHESVDNGTVVTINYKVENVDIGPSGTAAADLILRGGSSKIRMNCIADVGGQKTKHDLDKSVWQGSCHINAKGHYQASIKLKNVDGCEYVGSASIEPEAAASVIPADGYGSIRVVPSPVEKQAEKEAATAPEKAMAAAPLKASKEGSASAAQAEKQKPSPIKTPVKRPVSCSA